MLRDIHIAIESTIRDKCCVDGLEAVVDIVQWIYSLGGEADRIEFCYSIGALFDVLLLSADLVNLNHSNYSSKENVREKKNERQKGKSFKEQNMICSLKVTIMII